MEKDRLIMLAKKNTISLIKSLAAAQNDFQVSKVAALDKKVAILLSTIADKPDIRIALKSELNSLYLRHQQLLNDCQRETLANKRSLTYLQQNREGLLAYQEMEK